MGGAASVAVGRPGYGNATPRRGGIGLGVAGLAPELADRPVQLADHPVGEA